MDRRKAVLIYWIPVFLWMAVIFAFSSIHGRFLEKVGILGFDKITHIAEYFILCVLLIRAFLCSELGTKLSTILVLSVIIASLYGVSDEYHQHFTPGRRADIYDLIADVTGSGLGILLYGRRVKDCCK